MMKDLFLEVTKSLKEIITHFISEIILWCKGLLG